MELPPFNLEDFNKWKQSQAIVKVSNNCTCLNSKQ